MQRELKARRAQILRELAGVEKQIAATQKALSQIEARLAALSQSQQAKAA